jgi:cytochrome b
MTPHESIAIKIAELDTSLKESTPRMTSLLREIHQNLSQDPDIVTLLSPTEVATIVAGLSKQTNTTIMTQVISGKKGKSDRSLSLDDI